MGEHENWKLDYMHEKVAQATSSLVLESRPRYVAGAFEILRRILPEDARIDDAEAATLWDTVKRSITPTDEDKADPRASEHGTLFVRAARLTDEERLVLKNALWDLHCWLQRGSDEHYSPLPKVVIHLPPESDDV